MKITPKAKRNISRIIPFAIIWLAIGWIIDITALLLLCMIDGFSRFEDARSLASQVGICPRVYSSGSSVRGRGSICNLGSSKLRKLLYMCSWAAKTCNPACADLYKRMIQKGKPLLTSFQTALRTSSFVMQSGSTSYLCNEIKLVPYLG